MDGTSSHIFVAHYNVVIYVWPKRHFSDLQDLNGIYYDYIETMHFIRSLVRWSKRMGTSKGSMVITAWIFEL